VDYVPDRDASEYSIVDDDHVTESDAQFKSDCDDDSCKGQLDQVGARGREGCCTYSLSLKHRLNQTWSAILL
jgi:hypothetical protein